MASKFLAFSTEELNCGRKTKSDGPRRLSLFNKLSSRTLPGAIVVVGASFVSRSCTLGFTTEFKYMFNTRAGLSGPDDVTVPFFSEIKEVLGIFCS